MKTEGKAKLNNLIVGNLLRLAFSTVNTPFFKNVLFPFIEMSIKNSLKRIPGPVALPGVVEDKFYMFRAMVYSGFRVGATSKFANTIVNKAILSDLRAKKELEFRSQFGFDPPGFMTISPTKSCNLRCTGCYANSALEKDKLDYNILSRVIKEMRDFWGARFVVISGGEPLLYRWNGKDIFNIFEEHPDSLFLMYTNGTLIDEGLVQRMYRLGNITPAISVEGMKEITERRRGRGVFERIIKTMENLRKYRVTFGISITATHDNTEEIVSDEFVDFYFGEMGAAYAWVFHYMPIGRDIDPNLIPTPEQRLYLWEKSWYIVKNRKIMFVDFWNHGPVSDGCISSGRPGGYFYLDWQGNIYPCVFFPYAAANIGEIYARSGNLNNIINLSLHSRIRDWQFRYWKDGDLLRPCPIRDHYKLAKAFVLQTNATPADSAAKEILESKDYEEKMVSYDIKLEEKTKPIWEKFYKRRDGTKKATTIS